MTIREWCQAANINTVNHGFGENPIPTRLMLIVTEVAEAMEDYRKGHMNHFPEELADVAIRLFDLAGHLGIDLETAIERKHEYNLTRPFKHGGKIV